MDEVLLPEILPEQAVVIANGLFPDHPIPLEILQKSNFNIYCDGAAKRSHLDKYAPDIIIGDLDSIQKDVYDKYREIIVRVETQDTSDLEKALLWCNKYSIKSVVILGASGLREDHLISNIFLLESYCQDFDHISMITNYGSFSPVYSEKIFESFLGQQVSIFCIDATVKITSEHLMYPLNKTSLNGLNKGISNESTSTSFTISLSHGVVVIFTSHGVK
ncbi:MAG: thiamine diphosphokinase [Candidatus Marinimicrobia bacterium]|jgi:thiamine pyrophosphokinase|nr:thiamine diphosphokinase [Candidatus Neomarinimicrobiota bacterium]MBT3633490.1 thiamine diphosphokinase [Candidatus Neomarinimicrobiota bacterium]MBT3681632.1 thiamine diphosphokinase [Candidatus Neomarinimicrobiota bacterium]MBT3758400.1 thiamine diphosphokinase [Candidatus Neomarinimicrobiota bacterium]MBT3894946.1 thiamine diphosphokinase [Candidatus Neomarinimicrobiota bacterium]